MVRHSVELGQDHRSRPLSSEPWTYMCVCLLVGLPNEHHLGPWLCLPEAQLEQVGAAEEGAPKKSAPSNTVKEAHACGGKSWTAKKVDSLSQSDDGPA